MGEPARSDSVEKRRGLQRYAIEESRRIMTDSRSGRSTKESTKMTGREGSVWRDWRVPSSGEGIGGGETTVISEDDGGAFEFLVENDEEDNDEEEERVNAVLPNPSPGGILAWGRPAMGATFAFAAVDDRTETDVSSATTTTANCGGPYLPLRPVTAPEDLQGGRTPCLPVSKEWLRHLFLPLFILSSWVFLGGFRRRPFASRGPGRATEEVGTGADANILYAWGENGLV